MLHTVLFAAAAAVGAGAAPFQVVDEALDPKDFWSTGIVNIPHAEKRFIPCADNEPCHLGTGIDMHGFAGPAVPLKRSEREIADLQARAAGGLPDVDPRFLVREAALVHSRYGDALSKRALGEVPLQDTGLDASYTGTVTIGGSQSFQVVLDTGSSDFWVESSDCDGCSGGTTFDVSKSSSFVDLKAPYKINYGSGSASGTLAQDTVTMGEYTVASQVFALVNQMTKGLMSGPMQGILGLGFKGLSRTGATPWWLTLQQSAGAWEFPGFAFYMKRWRNVANAPDPADGGMATFGYLDNSLYSGDIHYVSTSRNDKFWQITLDSISTGGNNVDLGGLNQVAIDTGTTLMGAPASVVKNFYAAIPGARQMSGSYQNYYEYPCSHQPNAVMTFGGHGISIADADFNLGRWTSSQEQGYCVGALFVLNGGTGHANWVVGGTLLKNTFTVFRADPPAVGFAALAQGSSSETTAAPSADATNLMSGGIEGGPPPPDMTPVDEGSDAPVPTEIVGAEEASVITTPLASTSANASPSPSGSASGSASDSASASASASGSGSATAPGGTKPTTSKDGASTPAGAKPGSDSGTDSEAAGDSANAADGASGTRTTTVGGAGATAAAANDSGAIPNAPGLTVILAAAAAFFLW